MVEHNKVFILPGEYFISKQPHLISTLLGSCVAVCLYSPVHHFGGMNHYMLPTSPNKERSGKYGDYAISVLFQFFQRTIGSLNGLQAIVSGGANVITPISSGAQIGQKNLEIARKMLKENNIPILKENLGGTVGLKLHYQNWDNQLKVEFMDRNRMDGSLIHREENSRLCQTPAFTPPVLGSPASAPGKAAPKAPAKPQAGQSLSSQSAGRDSSKPVTGARIKVLIVDDSAIVRNLLSKAMEGEPDIVVVGAAKDAYEAREMLLEKGPDVMTLDIVMPKMDGVTFLKKLMVYYPLPVIICSTIAKAGSQAELRSDKIGAVDVIDKESLNLYHGLDKVKQVLIPKIRAAAKTKVFKKAKEEVASI
ncbi:MAG: response regulator [Deltaproteobacteria bacterium]|jgi:two-component system chemotaxis response regulator CheB|nr:response regulator [Deltaproteobacteria bacterium]